MTRAATGNYWVFLGLSMIVEERNRTSFYIDSDTEKPTCLMLWANIP